MSGGAEQALTARQRRFVEEYLVCGDAAEAAVAAGYSPRGAAARGEALLRDPAKKRDAWEDFQKVRDKLKALEGEA